MFATTAGIAAVVALAVILTLPPAAIRLEPDLPRTMAMGAYHVHTSRSDGTGDPDSIAAAAAGAGLSFVILTDHGDGTRPPDPPTYRHGVLSIDGLEINTTAGHVVALGLGAASPYPIAGSAPDVLEDVHRMGGVAVLAHPDSPNPQLRWQAGAATADGLEWINVDSEWRDEGVLDLLGTALHGMIRGPAAMAALFSRPGRTLARWDAEAARRPMFGIAALDAHANIAWRGGREPRPRGLPFPGYVLMFRTLAQVVDLDAPFSGDPIADAGRLLRAIAAGRSYSIVRGFADPAALQFSARAGDTRVTMGSRVDAGQPLTFRASITGDPGARIAILRQGRLVAQGVGSVEHTDATPGVYRVEVSLPGRSAPWLVSNPIVIAAPIPPNQAPEPTPDGEVVSLSLDPSVWTVEREPSSAGTVAREPMGLRFTFSLGPGTPRGQYAALVRSVPADIGIDRIEFVASADRPMRVSVQIRTPDALGGQRWRRSVFVDRIPRPIRVPLEEFEPADAPTSRRPVVARVQSLLFVVDTLNTLTGASGTLRISDVGVGTPPVTSER
ncbi:MAG: CehA/McbA family metallohydrolase [Acidobacteria bacterium]|nr:CehA/McbA family metallohydrolase [Acidobacteriota bacterium]